MKPKKTKMTKSFFPCTRANHLSQHNIPTSFTNRDHTPYETMPAIDFKALFNEERERRRLQKQQSEAGGAGGNGGSGGGGGAGGDTRVSADDGTPPPLPTCELAKRSPLKLEDYEIAKQFGVRGLHYIPDFITEEEERSILRGVYAVREKRH